MPGISPYMQNETLNIINPWVSSPVLERETSMTNLRTIIIICQLLKSFFDSGFVFHCKYISGSVVLLVCASY